MFLEIALVQASAKLVICKKNYPPNHTILSFLTLSVAGGGGEGSKLLISVPDNVGSIYNLPVES